MYRALIGILLFLSACMGGNNQNSVNQQLQQLVDQHQTPSVQYLFFDVDTVIHQYGTGMADVANAIPTDMATRYYAFSITKTFTALAVLQLVQQGKLKLNDPVKTYLPNFKYGDAITVRHLLSHSSGIPNPMPLSWVHLAEDHNSFDAAAFFYAQFKKHPKPNFKPNAKYAYSNLEYVVLGQLIESISGQNYEDYITQHILSKLNTNALSFTITKNTAKGYQKRFSFMNLLLGFFMDKDKFMGAPEGKWKPFKRFYVNGSAYSGLIATPTALMQYAQALLKADSPLISNNLKTELFTENYTNKGKATGMCLSWFTGKFKGHTYYTHAGGGGGYYCEIRLYPDLGKGSVIMFNRSGMTDERILDDFDRYFVQ